MDIIINNLSIPIEKDGIDEYITVAAQKLQVDVNAVSLTKILSKKLDLSDKEQFYYVVSFVIKTNDNYENKDNFPLYEEKIRLEIKPSSIKDRPIIIGFGPAGMFAALEFIEHGIKPIIFERGKKIEDRDIDVKRFIEERVLDEESNIQFGEGGAGSYSDGKLFSKRNNSYQANKVLESYIKFGAPEEISYIFKPHLGTDVLCEIVRKIRNYIIESGGEIFFSSKMTDIIISDGEVRGVIINGNKEYRSSIIMLAIGHSARDTFEIINKKGVHIEQKPISVGVRVEHPAEIINLTRYGKKYLKFKGLGAANYSFTYTGKILDRNVNTFCMCPGGEVVNASSQNGMMAINGMSYSARDSAFSNAAIVVSCKTEDYKSIDPLAGIRFQQEIEKKAFKAGFGTWKVPAQNLTDFLSGRLSESLNDNSFKMGVTTANIREILPEFVADALYTAFNSWKEYYPLFVSEHAILLAPETRTSCPVRIKRSENFQSVNIKNLYPIGEGSGYAGGITSSAADAIKAVTSVLEYFS